MISGGALPQEAHPFWLSMQQQSIKKDQRFHDDKLTRGVESNSLSGLEVKCPTS